MTIYPNLPARSGMFRSWQTEYDTRRWSRIDKVVLHPKFIEFNKVGNADFEKSKGNFGKKLSKVGKIHLFYLRNMKLLCVFILWERSS